MFYDIFESLCAEYGVTPVQVRRDLGISQSTMASWKSRGLTPNAVSLVQLAEYFHTTPAYLAGNPMAKNPNEKAQTPKQRSPFKAGESYFGGDIKVTNVSVGDDGRETISINMDMGELSAEDIAGYLEMFKKMSALGMSVEGISRLVEAAANAANEISNAGQPITTPQSTPPAPGDTDTPTPQSPTEGPQELDEDG